MSLIVSQVKWCTQGLFQAGLDCEIELIDVVMMFFLSVGMSLLLAGTSFWIKKKRMVKLTLVFSRPMGNVVKTEYFCLAVVWNLLIKGHQ